MDLSLEDILFYVESYNRQKKYEIKIAACCQSEEKVFITELVLYKILKDERNKYNHMKTGGKMKFITLDSCVKLFVKMVENYMRKLLARHKEKKLYGKRIFSNV